MQQGFEQVTYLIGTEDILCGMGKAPALPLFSGQAKDFLAALSKRLLANPQAKPFPDLMDYAFWVRAASLKRMESRYPQKDRKIGRGVSFHIAPSNVPMAFALSFTAALLAGNGCIVRLSEKSFPQAEILLASIDRVLKDFCDLKPYLCFIRYPHDEAITASLSAVCDVRLIWGGDQTISAIRKAPLPPRAVELAFADRYSLAVIDADRYLEMDKEKVAEKFYLDTYYIDQNACSSPRLVCWLGENVEQAKKIFWESLGKLVRRDYEFAPIQAIDKLTAFCKAAACGGVKLHKEDNLVFRVELERLEPGIMEYKEGGGFFFEYTAQRLEELLPMLEKPCQTLCCVGVEPEKVRRMALENGVRGGDRVVPIGETNKLTLLWDGFDLCESMSRYVNVGSEE